MKQEHPTISLDNDSFGWALCLEIGLGVLALLCGWTTHVWPAEHLAWPISFKSAALGVISALPPLAIMLAARRVPWSVLQELTQFVDEKITPLFHNLNVLELALLSLAAGWGEELLFRGLIQAEITHGTNVVVGIGIASFVFALLHPMSIAYFVMAFVMGVYFGWLFWQFESLWVPILGHAFYDFLMLLYVRRVGAAKPIAE